MYGVLDYVITGMLALLSLTGSVAIISTIDEPQGYVRLGYGLRVLMIQLIIMTWVLWFGFEGRTIGHGLMTTVTWSVVALKMIAFMRTTGTIENPSYVRRRTPFMRVWDSVSTGLQTAGLALMFGLALAYGG